MTGGADTVWVLRTLTGGALTAALVLSPTAAFAQGPDARNASVASVGDGLDRFLMRAAVAADAAAVVLEADVLRKEASVLLSAGCRDEARVLLRRAGEAIAAAAPDGATMRDDPFLREYLGEVADELRRIDEPSIRMIEEGRFPEVSAGRLRRSPATSLSRLRLYGPTITRVLREEGMPEWLLAVGLVESGYSPSALSPKGALGIWQFMPATATRFGLARSSAGDERQDLVKSTRAAARYLRNLYALFGDWQLALAAYNSGEGRVARVIRTTGVRDFPTMAARGLLPAETVAYVPRILAAVKRLGLDLAPGKPGQRLAR